MSQALNPGFGNEGTLSKCAGSRGRGRRNPAIAQATVITIDVFSLLVLAPIYIVIRDAPVVCRPLLTTRGGRTRYAHPRYSRSVQRKAPTSIRATSGSGTIVRCNAKLSDVAWVGAGKAGKAEKVLVVAA